MTSLTVERELAFGLQNLGLPAGDIREKVDASIREFGLESERHSSPARLSGGELQRLALASTLILDPSYLILDEPTTLLSPMSRRKLLGAVEEKVRTGRVALLLITQFPEEALRARRLIVLHGGEIVFDGPPGLMEENTRKFDAWGIPVPVRMLMGLA